MNKKACNVKPIKLSGISKAQVDLDGLLNVLSENLYSTPAIVIRELIQNAQDACVRHFIETNENRSTDTSGLFSDVGQHYKIRINTDSANNTITISDNGSGLTADEIETYLATIGSGYTRKLRQATETEDMVGFFGLGFLSAYVVANKVEFVTQSFKEPATRWLFSSAKGKSFSITSVPTHDYTSGRHFLPSALSELEVENNEANTTTAPSNGSAVILHLKQEFASLSNIETLLSLLQKYCCLLPIPIIFGASGQRVNNLEAPWKNKEKRSPIAQQEIAHQFAQHFEPSNAPLWSFVLPENDLKVSGLIWIQASFSYSTSDNRNVSIFARNMFITAEHKDILPNWAGFCGAVIDSPSFQPTASRETLQKNEYYRNVQAFISEHITLKLRELVLKDPSTWQRILDRHGQALLGAALSDERLFSVMRKQLKVPTSMGDMTLPSALRKSDGSLYLQLENEQSHTQVLFNARMIPVVKGFLFGAAQFSRSFAASESIKLHELGRSEDDNQIFKVESANLELKQLLCELLVKEDEDLLLSRFEPESIPFISLIDQQAKLKQQIESEQSTQKIGAAALSLARLHASSIKQDKLKKLFINLNNPLIQTLLKLDNARQKSVAVLIRSFMESSAQTSFTNDNEANISGNASHSGISGAALSMQNFNEATLALLNHGNSASSAHFDDATDTTRK